MTGSPYADEVRAYLADCGRACAELQARGGALDPKYHPTADGAVKMIAHRSDHEEAQKIRQVFAELHTSVVGGVRQLPSQMKEPEPEAEAGL